MILVNDVGDLTVKFPGFQFDSWSMRTAKHGQLFGSFLIALFPDNPKLKLAFGIYPKLVSRYIKSI